MKDGHLWKIRIPQGYDGKPLPRYMVTANDNAEAAYRAIGAKPPGDPPEPEVLTPEQLAERGLTRQPEPPRWPPVDAVIVDYVGHCAVA